MSAAIAALRWPTSEPALDRAGVEAARLQHLARQQLVTHEPSVTYALLARARAQKEATVRQWVRRLRNTGSLVTVDHDGVTLIPSFQFDDSYDPNPVIGAAVSKLTAAGMTGWAVWHWFCNPNAWLDARPVDVAAARPDDVIRAAANVAHAGAG